jgi:hypothetical protein
MDAMGSGFGLFLKRDTISAMQVKSLPVVLLIGMVAAISAAGAQPAASQDTPGTGQSAASPPSADKARIYVYRAGSMVGAVGYDILFVNDEHLAALHNSNYAQCDIPPGTVVFSGIARVKKTPIAVDLQLITNHKKTARERFRMVVEPGKTYYVRWSVGGKMKLVDTDKGAKEMSGLHPAKD